MVELSPRRSCAKLWPRNRAVGRSKLWHAILFVSVSLRGDTSAAPCSAKDILDTVPRFHDCGSLRCSWLSALCQTSLDWLETSQLLQIKQPQGTCKFSLACPAHARSCQVQHRGSSPQFRDPRPCKAKPKMRPGLGMQILRWTQQGFT